MRTGPLDTTDDLQVKRFHEIVWRAEMEDGRPWNTMWSLEELVALLREPTPEMRTEGYAAWDDGEMVGAGFLMLSLLDNTDKAFAFVAVEPERRRRGIGSAVLAEMEAAVRAQARTSINGLAACHFEERDTAPQLLFARRHGYEVASTEVQRSLPLPVAEEALDAIDREIAPFTEGYEVRTFVGGLPDALLESYCTLANQLVLDAPTGEVDYEAEALTPQVESARRDRDTRSGRTLLTALALQGDTVVAYTDLAVPRAADQVLQRGTFVDRAHRGHRLGAAVKVANLRLLQERFPGARSVETTNSEVNEQMVSINDRLGYVAVSVVPNLLKRL